MKSSNLFHRADILGILLSSFLQGGDRPTLLSVAMAFNVHEEFITQARKLRNERVITQGVQNDGQ